MQQNELYPAPGSQKNRKRVGRGNGSGHGTYSGRAARDRSPDPAPDSARF
jgi:large subunit ribosomal protein L15